MAATATHFFFAHSGYSYPTGANAAERLAARWEGARRLAKAEKWAQDEELVFVWENDSDCTEDDFCFEEDKAHVREHGAVGCILYRPCEEHWTICNHAEHLASLWGITESLNNRDRDNYRRVVEAELALEVMSS